MRNWEHNDIWTMRADQFCVQVSRHTQAGHDDPHVGPHRWCVYAYIYPKHPHFARFEGNDTWQHAATEMPLHCGPSLLKWNNSQDGGIGSVQVGSDYNHLYDDEYTYMATAEQARSVFSDAERLYDWLVEKDRPAK